MAKEDDLEMVDIEQVIGWDSVLLDQTTLVLQLDVLQSERHHEHVQNKSAKSVIRRIAFDTEIARLLAQDLLEYVQRVEEIAAATKH